MVKTTWWLTIKSVTVLELAQIKCRQAFPSLNSNARGNGDQPLLSIIAFPRHHFTVCRDIPLSLLDAFKVSSSHYLLVSSFMALSVLYFDAIGAMGSQAETAAFQATSCAGE
ncbi:hypothetical protein WG66_008873 [Moniliophthora roreri]|nr:hypothetical protein WG66_008873 [Moniliophthora roreri]